MSNFWSKALGGTPAQPPATVAPAPTTQPWWTPTLPQPMAQPPVAAPPAGPQPPSKAQSARSSETCPECMSGNIFRPNGVPNAMPQCYECGWNPRFAHSTAGAGMPSDSSAPAQPARQVSTGNNFNPTTIVGRID